jgi:hypothetical protein
MVKNTLSAWSTTAANNTDVGGISIAEGMATADVNNAIREVMAQLAADFASNAWQTTGVAAPDDNLNSIVENGIYSYTSAATNAPDGVAAGAVLHAQPSTNRGWQISARSTVNANPNLHWRELTGDGWSTWREIFHFPAAGTGLLSITNGALVFSADEDAGLIASEATYGFSARSNGQVNISRADSTPLFVKRGNDGTLLALYSGTTLAGLVTVSAGVVTYGSFCGSHWSQFRSLARPNVLRGTILETIDRLCEWDDATEDVLPQVAIASVCSPSVYGVFSHWDEGTRDLHVASLGANVIRIAADQTVKRGDLIEAGPNGCGVVQNDTAFRSSTVAKVTAALKSETYPDGSYLVPCTLHCG